MIQILNLLLLLVASALGSTKARPFSSWIIRLASLKAVYGLSFVAALSLLGCLSVSLILHEPVPRVHDEFSYALMADTFAHGRISNPAPPLPEFFETFHVIVRPVYASKYFPAQGLLMALGQKLTGHPAVGVWLSSALACAATYWMLRAWINPVWALVGALLMVVQYGFFSYWSQSYWGGMLAALGGALAFGAVRRLWDQLSWKSSLWLALGIIVLMNSRPLEGLLALTPISVFGIIHFWKESRSLREFCGQLALPLATMLTVGAFVSCEYNRTITGSAVTPPYVLNEQQYQESPQFSFLPLRPKISYSSSWLRYYYEVNEMRGYLSQRTPTNILIVAARKLLTWWGFYCGMLLSAPLVMPCLFWRGWIRYCQILVLAGFVALAVSGNAMSVPERLTIDALAFLQIGLLWIVFNGFFPRLAIATNVLLIIEVFFTKWAFPHYFAPAACLVLYLQIEGLRKMWDWNPRAEGLARASSRHEHRRVERENKTKPRAPVDFRGLVYLLPLVCLLSVLIRIEARLSGWNDDVHGPERGALLSDDWGVRRSELERWLEQQPTPQLVFVKYSASHDVNAEWVYNHADLMNAHVIWARDLGSEHNRLLLHQMPNRTVWLLQADTPDPELIRYGDLDKEVRLGDPPNVGPVPKRKQLNW